MEPTTSLITDVICADACSLCYRAVSVCVSPAIHGRQLLRRHQQSSILQLRWWRLLSFYCQNQKGDSIPHVMWPSRRLRMSRPRCPGEQQRSPSPVHRLSRVPSACWETILLYMLLIGGPFHSHRTQTCPHFLIKQQQPKRVWHSKANNPTKHINNRFHNGNKTWKFGNSNHRCRQTKAPSNTPGLTLFSFNVCFHWSLFVKRKPWRFSSRARRRKKIMGRGIHEKIPNETKITKLKWMDVPLNLSMSPFSHSLSHLCILIHV